MRKPRLCRRLTMYIIRISLSAGCGNEPAMLPGANPCQTSYALYYVNTQVRQIADLTPLELSYDLSVDMVRHLAGSDGNPFTTDDREFETFDDVRALAGAREAELSGLIGAASRGFCPATDRVVFAPGPLDWSHLARTIHAIDSAQHSIDISMYSFGNSDIREALQRAAQDRNVAIRILYEGALDDNKSANWSSTISGLLESGGAEVRWTNIINHHKFAIIDGPRTSLDEASTATLISGSANWGNSAASRYDESTVIINGDATIVLPFQREFNRLWAGSRGRTDPSPPTIAIPDPKPGDEVEVLFTSANFDIKESSNGPVFSVRKDATVVQDRLVEIIKGATQSVWIAADHFRLRPMAEALIEQHITHPDIDIRVYVDQQEYRSEADIEDASTSLANCIKDEAPYSPEAAKCYDEWSYFANQLAQTGIPVRFKKYSHDWDIGTSRLMHHKYIIVDGQIIAAGSYNLSNHAEQESLENMVIYTHERFPDIVDAYRENFAAIWQTGIREQRYQRTLNLLQHSNDPIPIDFAPMAIDWNQASALGAAFDIACPAKDTASATRVCNR